MQPATRATRCDSLQEQAQWLFHWDPAVRMALLSNPALAPEARRVLMDDPDERVRQAARLTAR